MFRNLNSMAVVFVVACFGFAQIAPADPPFRLIFEAEWNDIPCSDYPLTPERWAAECFGPLVNTQVDCLL